MRIWDPFLAGGIQLKLAGARNSENTDYGGP